MENKYKHLELISKIIERLSDNSFLLKRWSVLIAVAIITLEIKNTTQDIIYISFIPLFIFWVLDGVYLSKERKFRSLYEYVRKLPEKDIDFRMDPHRFHSSKNSLFASMFSITQGVFYISLIISMALVVFFIKS